MAAPSGLGGYWNGTNAGIPTGYSRITALDSKIPKGSTVAGNTGGSDTHTHPDTAHTHTDSHGHASITSGVPNANDTNNTTTSGSGSTASTTQSGHTHTISFNSGTSTSGTSTSGTSSSGGNLPTYKPVIFISSNGTDDIPSAFGAFWAGPTTTIPTGWAFADGTGGTTDLRTTFLRGAAAGADSSAKVTASAHNHTFAHTHPNVSHGHTSTHAGDGTAVSLNITGANRPTGNHTHPNNATYSNTSSGMASDSTASSNQTPEPAYVKLHHVQSTGTVSSVAVGLIFIWTGAAGSIPNGYQVCDGTNGTPDLSNTFTKGTTTNGDELGTGGSSSHDHTINHAHGPNAHTHANSAGITGTITTVVSIATGTGDRPGTGHTHTAGTSGAANGTSSSDTDTLTSQSADPAYSTVIYIQRVPISVSKSTTFKWNTKVSVSKDTTLKWNEAAQISKSITLKWDTAGAVSKNTALLWQTAGFVQKDTILKWNTQESISKSTILEWNTQGAISKDSTLKWNTLEYISDSHTFEWNTQEGIDTSRILEWGVAGPISKTFTLKWNTLEYIDFDITLLWDTKEVVELSRTLLWDEDAEIEKSQILKWDTQEYINFDETFLWNTVVSVTKTTILKWDTVQAISKSATIKWNTLEYVEDSRTLEWNTAGKIETSRTLEWDTAASVTKSVTFKWNTQQYVTRSRTLKWNTLIFVDLVSRTLKWGVSARISKNTTLKWQLVKELYIDYTLRWDVIEPLHAIVSKRLMWQIQPNEDRINKALYGGAQAFPAYKFVYERRTKTNGLIDDVTCAIESCSLDLNNDRVTLRTATFVLDLESQDDHYRQVTINPLVDIIAVFMDFVVDDTRVRLPMGLYQLVTPAIHTTPRTLQLGTKPQIIDDKTVTVQASDLTIHLLQHTTTTALHINSGVNPVTGSGGVRSILDTHGLIHAIPDPGANLALAMDWPVGTPWLTVVNDLLDAVNYYSLWFDVNGVAKSRARSSISAQSADVVYTSADWITDVGIDENPDMTRFANQVVLYVTDAALTTPLTSTKTNTDPSSPTSTVTLGRTISKPIPVPSAVSQTVLDAKAVSELEQAAADYVRMTMTTPIDPRREAHEIYELTVTDLYDAERWLLRNWKAELKTGGLMTHTLGRVVSLVPA